MLRRGDREPADLQIPPKVAMATVVLTIHLLLASA
jgi:hypothetical protein